MENAIFQRMKTAATFLLPDMVGNYINTGIYVHQLMLYELNFQQN